MRGFPKIPALMFQAAASNSGKTLICAGFCRALARMGLRVVPFKSQNMSLNSHVTIEGGEMGRAQALQALAAGLSPDVRMNPVLLKPMGERGSQVIVLGKPAGLMAYADYVREKKRLWRIVRDAYYSLVENADLALIEGAGSPAEINLRDSEIVNMKVAKETGAAVALIADIDRGGAFAALAGTISLLTPAEKRRIKGLLLNKFRGDESLLQPALEQISRRTGKPFWGVVPMLENLRLPEEDSVSFKSGDYFKRPAKNDACLDVAVVDFPSIGNFTDLDALAAEPDVRARAIRSAEEFDSPDILLLPGTRSSRADLDWIRERGIAEQILRLAAKIRQGAPAAIVGICGGLQIMGDEITDPQKVESDSDAAGLGLLRLSTEMSPLKTLRQCEPVFYAQRASFRLKGYEIHHGVSRGDAPVVMRAPDGTPLGWANEQNPDAIWGTYLHGVFDDDNFRRAFLNTQRVKRGLKPLPSALRNPLKDLDLLADVITERVNVRAALLAAGLDAKIASAFA